MLSKDEFRDKFEEIFGKPVAVKHTQLYNFYKREREHIKNEWKIIKDSGQLSILDTLKPSEIKDLAPSVRNMECEKLLIERTIGETEDILRVTFMILQELKSL